LIMQNCSSLFCPVACLKRILIIEDEADFAAHIWQFLESRGFQLDHAANGPMGLKMLREQSFDAAILDLGLPGLDGVAVCKAARALAIDLPILALTARDQLADKLSSFGAGVDDYVVKPVALTELEARLHAVMRRATATAPKLVFGVLTLDVSTMTAVRENRTILLTAKLGALLKRLMQSAPQTVSHAALMESVWEGSAVDMNSLHSQISNLRAVIDRPFARAMIHTEAGTGYALRE
jgi:DNA-binding response OmpR family regulator